MTLSPLPFTLDTIKVLSFSTVTCDAILHMVPRFNVLFPGGNMLQAETGSERHAFELATQYKPVVASHSLVPQVQATFKDDPSATVHSPASVNDKENTKKSIKVLFQYPMLIWTTLFSSNFLEKVGVLSIPPTPIFVSCKRLLEPCVLASIKITRPTKVTISIVICMIFLQDCKLMPVSGGMCVSSWCNDA